AHPSISTLRHRGGRRGAGAIPEAMGYLPQAYRRQLPGSSRGQRHPPTNLKRGLQVALLLSRHCMWRRQHDEDSVGRNQSSPLSRHRPVATGPRPRRGQPRRRALRGRSRSLRFHGGDNAPAGACRRRVVQPIAPSLVDRRQVESVDVNPPLGRTAGDFPALRACASGEDRAAFLDRFMRTTKPLWTVLTPAEWDQVWRHISTCDFPETTAVWCELGREAGFEKAQQIFVDPTDFYQLFPFEA